MVAKYPYILKKVLRDISLAESTKKQRNMICDPQLITCLNSTNMGRAEIRGGSESRFTGTF
jgi:hypothetical protein